MQQTSRQQEESEKIRQTNKAQYITAARAIESVILFKKNFIKLLQQEINLHEGEKSHLMEEHERILEDISQDHPENE